MGYTIGIAVHACLYVEYYVHGHAVVLVLLLELFSELFICILIKYMLIELI